MTLGEYIKGYRKSNDMTMDDFAKKSGLSKGYISVSYTHLTLPTKRIV